MQSPPLAVGTPKRRGARRVPVPKRIRALEAQLKGLRYKVAVDVEHTGGAAGLGATFSLSMVALVRANNGKWRVVRRTSLSYNPLTADERAEHARMRATPETYTVEARAAFLRQLWAAHQWDQDTLTEYWLKNLDLFDSTLNDANQPSEQVFNTVVGDAMRSIEHDYGQDGNTVEYVWDTMHVDPVRCDRILERNNGELGMNYFRNGQHGCQSWHLRSILVGLLAGALRIEPSDVDYKIYVSPVMQKLRAMANRHVLHDHIAEHDAEHLGWMFVYAPDAVAEFVDELMVEASNEQEEVMAQPTLYDRALAFATKYHQGQVRKNALAEPYITHPVGVAQLLVEAGIHDPIVLAAALLHDTVEDTAATDALVRAEFGDEVADVVAEVTDNKSLAKDERKRLQIENAPHKSSRAALVKAADKLHNLRDMVDSPPRGWSVDRIQGYWVWARMVLDGLSIDSEWLRAQLAELFRTATIEVEGDRVLILPESEDERQRVYKQYMRHMAEANIAP